MIARNAFTEEYDVLLEDAAAGRATRHDKAREVDLVEVGVAVGQ